MTPCCPQCGANLDGVLSASALVSVKPRPGSLAVCMHCGVALIYTDELLLRLLTFEEWHALDWESKQLMGRATATVAAVQLYSSYLAERGESPMTFEQLLRWALLGRKFDA